MNIAILEDDIDQANLLLRWLNDEGHKVEHRTNGADFLQLIESGLHDIFILDWQLPDQTGIDVLRKIRNTMDRKVPILFATQRNQEQDIVKALDNGADDYLVKPLRHLELLARINALLRRAVTEEEQEILQLGPIEINTRSESVLVENKKVQLTQKDYLLACCLIRNFGKVLSREYLLKEVWGLNADLNTRTVDVHISRIRRSLKIGPEIGYYIKTIYHHGYRLEKME